MISPTKTKGFTFIEMLVILVVLGLITAAATPNLIAFTKARDRKAFQLELKTLCLDAKQRAITTGTNYKISFSESENQVELRQAIEGEEPDALKTIPVPEDYEATNLDLAGRIQESTSWEVVYYDDGTCDAGGIEFASGNDVFCWLIDPKTGLGKIQAGSLPDATTEKWEAGTYEQRL